jgi:hypothetical protein
MRLKLLRFGEGVAPGLLAFGQVRALVAASPQFARVDLTSGQVPHVNLVSYTRGFFTTTIGSQGQRTDVAGPRTTRPSLQAPEWRTFLVLQTNTAPSAVNTRGRTQRPITINRR